MKDLMFSMFRSSVIAICVLAAAGGCFGQTADALIEKAKASIAKKEYASAISDLSTAIATDPTSSEAFFRRAYAYYLTGEYQKGLADTDGSIRLNAKNGTTYGLRGMINSKLKNYDAAVLDNTKAIELNPEKSTWYYNRAVAYERKPSPEWKLAEADLTKSVDLGANDADTYYNRALARKKLEDWLPAENDLYQVVERTPSASLYIELSEVNMKLRHYREAVDNAKEAIKREPNNEAAAKAFKEALGSYGAASPHSDADLFSAIANNDFNAVMLALAGGASPNAVGEYSSIKNHTPLLAAVRAKNAEIAALLLKAGAKVDAADSYGNTPLGLAVVYSDAPPAQRAAIVSTLIKGGADVNRRNSNGDTPLIGACLYAYDEILAALVKGGADVNAKNSGGANAMSACSGRASVKGLKTLIDAGASVAAEPGQVQPIKNAIERNGSGIGQAYLFLRAGSEVPTPADDGEKYKDGYAFVTRIKALPRGSAGLKLFDAVVDDRGSDLDALLKTVPSLDPVLLNYLLLIAVGNDNGSITSILIAKGADPNFAVGDSTAKTVALFGKKTAVAQYLGDLSAASGPPNNTDKQKLLDAIERVRNGIAAANKYVAQINDMNSRGVEKGKVCVVARRAKQELLYARQDLQAADKIGLIEYRQKMTEAKDNMEAMIRSLNVTGCF